MKAVLCGIALLSCCVWANANTYCNARFDFCVDHPSSLKTQYPESANGDGRVFKLSGSQADIRVYGTNTPSVLYESDKKYLTSLKSEYAAENNVTYAHYTSNSYTVSGYNAAGNIFYDVIKVKNGQAVILHFDYPTSEKKRMAAIIKEMSSSLILK